MPLEESPRELEMLDTRLFLARAMANELGRQHPLPLTARSRTRAEVDKRSQLFTIMLLALFCPLAFAALAAVTFGGGPESSSLGVPMTLLVIALIIGIFVFGEFRARKWQGYRDPEIVLEVRDDGIAIRSPGHSSMLPYPDVHFSFTTMLLVTKFSASKVFVGIQLDTPLGKLRIDDDFYRPGRIAAAAIAFKTGDKPVPPLRDAARLVARPLASNGLIGLSLLCSILLSSGCSVQRDKEARRAFRENGLRECMIGSRLSMQGAAHADIARVCTCIVDTTMEGKNARTLQHTSEDDVLRVRTRCGPMAGNGSISADELPIGPNPILVMTKLEAAANEINATAPRKLDQFTTLERVSADRLTLIYHYRVDSLDARIDALRRRVESKLIPAACTGSQRRDMQNLGITYSYEYSDSGSDKPFKVTVNERTCEEKGR
jgi:hypothetical protein